MCSLYLPNSHDQMCLPNPFGTKASETHVITCPVPPRGGTLQLLYHFPSGLSTLPILFSQNSPVSGEQSEKQCDEPHPEHSPVLYWSLFSPRRRAPNGPRAHKRPLTASHLSYFSCQEVVLPSDSREESDSPQRGCYRSSPGSQITGIQDAANWITSLRKSTPEN